MTTQPSNPIRPGGPSSEHRLTQTFLALVIANAWQWGFDPLDIPWDFMPWLAAAVLGYQASRAAPKTAAAYGVKNP